MSQSRFSEYEVDITPDMIAGIEQHADLATLPDMLDDRGRYWHQRKSDDYLPSLRSGLQIQWTFSRLCNFTCVHCFNNSSPHWKGVEADPFPVADRIISAQPYNVCLCGGEPLIWKPLLQIIEKLRNGNVPLVSMVTNGYQGKSDMIKKVYDAGLTNMQVSIDGTNDQEFRELRVKSDGFERAVNCVKECVKHDWEGDMSVSFSPTRNNIGSWKKFCRMFADMGIRHIRTQPLMPVGAGCGKFDLLPTDEQYQQFHLDCKELQDELPGTFVDWGDHLEHIWFYTKTEAAPWCFGIQTDGWFELSCYIPVLLGSSIEHSIEDFWAMDIKRFWQSPIVRHFADILVHSSGMSELDVQIYHEDSLHIDVFDDEQQRIFLECDDLNVLREISNANVQKIATQLA